MCSALKNVRKHKNILIEIIPFGPTKSEHESCGIPPPHMHIWQAFSAYRQTIWKNLGAILCDNFWVEESKVLFKLMRPEASWVTSNSWEHEDIDELWLFKIPLSLERDTKLFRELRNHFAVYPVRLPSARATERGRRDLGTADPHLLQKRKKLVLVLILWQRMPLNFVQGTLTGESFGGAFLKLTKQAETRLNSMQHFIKEDF